MNIELLILLLALHGGCDTTAITVHDPLLIQPVYIQQSTAYRYSIIPYREICPNLYIDPYSMELDY